MKRLLIQTLSLLSLASVPAFAADLPATPMPYKAPPPVEVPYTTTWTGCYIGGNVGAAFDKTNVTDEVAGYEIGRLSNTAIAGGGQVGCDYQFSGNWVIGIQGMFDGTGLKADTTSPVLAPLTLHG